MASENTETDDLLDELEGKDVGDDMLDTEDKVEPSPEPDADADAEIKDSEAPVDVDCDDTDCRLCIHYALRSKAPVTAIAEDLRIVTRGWTRSFCGTQPRQREEFKWVSPELDCRNKSFTKSDS